MADVKRCLSCKKEVFGRADKKFCDDQCRNDYNNRLNGESNNYMRRVNLILKKNRRILQKLNNRDKARYPKERLLNEGFNFSYFTNLYKTKEGKVYYYCYELGILALDKDWFLIVKKKDY